MRIVLVACLFLWGFVFGSQGAAADETVLDASACPNFELPICIDWIRQKIDQELFSDAMDAAEMQCHEENSDLASELGEQELLLRVSACHTLSRLQRLMGQHERSYESQERTQRLSRFGCRAGFRGLCEFYSSFLRNHIQSLVAEIAYAWTKYPERRRWRPTIDRIRIGREFPESFSQIIKEAIEQSFALDDNLRTHKVQLQIDLQMTGDDVSLLVIATDSATGKLLWKKRLRSLELRQRYRYYGTNYRSPDAIWSRNVENYQPLYRNMIGFGIASIPNNSGEELDQLRQTIEVRSSEVFSRRSSSFGLLSTVHMTQRHLLGVPENEEEMPSVVTQEEEEGIEEESYYVRPYRIGYGVYGVYGHIFGGGAQFYDSNRLGVHLAAGFFATADFIAPSSRFGVDVYIGRHWAISLSGLFIGKTTTYFDANAKENDNEVGGGLALSFLP